MSSNDYDSDDSSNQESDDSLESLKKQVFALRQETNYDVKSSKISSKKMISEEFHKCIQIANTIFSAQNFVSKTCKFQAPTYETEKHTKQVSSYGYIYIKLYQDILGDPEKFAKIIYREIKSNPSFSNFVAYTLLPLIYNYFIDETCCERMQSLLLEILRIFQEENNDEADIEIFIPLFKSYFLGAYGFNDLLWNTYYTSLTENKDLPHFERLKKCIEMSSPTLPHHLPVLGNLILASHEVGMRFLIHGILKPSFELYEFLFAGTDVALKIRSLFNMIQFSPADETIQEIQSAFFNNARLIKKSIPIINMELPEGIALTMTCETWAKFLKMIKPEDELFSQKSQEVIVKSISELEAHRNSTFSLAIYLRTAKDPTFIPEKSDNKQFSLLLNHLKKSAEEASVDPFSLLHQLNPKMLNSQVFGENSVSSTEEFTRFALKEELKSLKCKKNFLNYVVDLTMIHQSIISLSKTLENIMYNSYNTLIHRFSSDVFGIPQNIRPNKIVSTFSNALKYAQKAGFPSSSWNSIVIPLLCTVFDNVNKLPNLKDLVKAFKGVDWKFQEKVQNEYNVELNIVKNEIKRIHKILSSIIHCPCGQQLVKFTEVANHISIISNVCMENGIPLAPNYILNAAFPIDIGSDLLLSIIRIYQIWNLFNHANVQVPRQFFQKLDLMNSWVMGMLQEESTTIVEMMYPQVTKTFS
ncbi:hypothetical protein TRFO_03228 [Tritrichomonas foetus]|uniref:Uncharacterized protein n=1 Tax=Tritrichomonas foetus TaxID=1144522 RepID=A0A1J4KX84_9EUKA|nr:hypothetical protein TRFO_03228 [Tritrichomonas foetus]|eukprot:OHT14165.1 hypothetical protein TRFO_03228 [Tritrichomonas foetus]